MQGARQPQGSLREPTLGSSASGTLGYGLAADRAVVELLADYPESESPPARILNLLKCERFM